MRRILVLGVVGALLAGALGVAAHLIARDTVGLPATDLERRVPLAPPAARGGLVPTVTTAPETTATVPEPTTTEDEGSGRGPDDSGSDNSGPGSENSGRGSDHSGRGGGGDD